MGRALARVPTWAWLAAIVVGSTIVRAILARPRRAVHHGRRDHLVGGARGIADAGEPLLRDQPDPGYSVVYPLLISPAYALFDSLVDAYAGVKTLNARPHVARRRACVLPRPTSRPRRLRAARRAPGGRGSVDGVHGHRHDRERVLPALPRRGARPRGRARAPDAALVVLLLAPRRARVRDARAGGRPRAGDPLAPLVLALFERRRLARPSPGSGGCTGSWPGCRRGARLPARVGRPARRVRARRRALVRPRRGASATSGGTSPSSRSTSS